MNDNMKYQNTLQDVRMATNNGKPSRLSGVSNETSTVALTGSRVQVGETPNWDHSHEHTSDSTTNSTNCTINSNHSLIDIIKTNDELRRLYKKSMNIFIEKYKEKSSYKINNFNEVVEIFRTIKINNVFLDKNIVFNIFDSEYAADGDTRPTKKQFVDTIYEFVRKNEVNELFKYVEKYGLSYHHDSLEIVKEKNTIDSTINDYVNTFMQLFNKYLENKNKYEELNNEENIQKRNLLKLNYENAKADVENFENEIENAWKNISSWEDYDDSDDESNNQILQTRRNILENATLELKNANDELKLFSKNLDNSLNKIYNFFNNDLRGMDRKLYKFPIIENIYLSLDIHLREIYMNFLSTECKQYINTCKKYF